MAWAGVEKNTSSSSSLFTYSLIIHDLKANKRDVLLPKEENNLKIITVVSTYPKEDSETKKWLISGDDNGDLKIFDLEEEGFKMLSKIETAKTRGGEILSAIIFDDRFNEINNDINKTSKNIYAMISFNDKKKPIRLYKHTLEGSVHGWILFKEIENSN